MCDSGRRNATYELLHCLLTFQVSPEFTDPTEPQVVKSLKLPGGQISVAWSLWRCWDRIWTWGIHFHWSLIMVPPDRFRCQSGPLAQFTLNRLLQWRSRFPQECQLSQLCKISCHHAILFRIERIKQWWNFHFSMLSSFWDEDCKV